MKVSYFSLADSKALAERSGRLGWYSEADWIYFMRTGVVFGHRLQSGELVSSAYFSNFENRAGSLGAVIVNPRLQGKKLGKGLIEKAISMIPNGEFVLSLIATERGKKMYEQAGFVEIGNTHKFVLNSSAKASTAADNRVESFLPSHFDRLRTLDKNSVGYDRLKLLKLRIEEATVTKVIIGSNGSIDGFAMTCDDGDRQVIGPVEAINLEAAKAVILALLVENKKFRIDVPHWQNDLINWLPHIGFSLERICPLMTYKGLSLPLTSDSYYAVVSQALG